MSCKHVFHEKAPLPLVVLPFCCCSGSCFIAINEKCVFYYFTNLACNISGNARVVFVGKPWWNHCWWRRQVIASPVREPSEVWVCLTGSMKACRSQRIDKPVMAFWSKPLVLTLLRSKVKAPQVLWSARARDSLCTRPGMGAGAQPLGRSSSRPDFPPCFHWPTNVTPSSSLCDQGDLWPWSLLQHSAPAHHLPRWLQLETGTVMMDSCLNMGFMNNNSWYVNASLSWRTYDKLLPFIVSFRGTFSVTWDPSWLMLFWAQLFPVLLLGRTNPVAHLNIS